jgi:iron complex outermembrane recepter protein
MVGDGDMKRFRLLTAVAVPALMMGLAAPAQAQDDTATEAQDEQVDSSNEIVVTAQGRAQVLADVPIAVSAINAESLELTGATDIRQLNQVAPSLLVSSTGSEANGSARIRGIGTVGDNPGLESSVAVFIDGVYRSRSGIGLNELGDLERIEVLRGPQGTLFGRNASAGLINIVSKAPSSTFSAGAEATYGNYDYIRVGGHINAPLGETLAGRIDGVFVKRDGYYTDQTSGQQVNDRDRYFVRGQLLFEPSSAFTVRLIADYSKRDENCCAATYIDQTVAPANANLLNPSLNQIVRVMRDMGQPLAAFTTPYDRDIYLTPGRTYGGSTEDWGVSAQIDWDLGGAKLTSITGYRDYFSAQASDTDYGFLDILYRVDDDNSSRSFKTLSQELRLQGEAFDGKLDWLIGAYYAHEDLTATDNLKFGGVYGRFAACRIIAGGGLAFAYDPSASGCIATALRPTVSGAFGAAGPAILAGFDRLDTVRNVGDTLSTYNQTSKNYAFFTHNIFEITEGFDLTVGVRYTHEKKDFDAVFGNNNTACPAQQAALTPFLSVAALQAVAGGLINLTCQGNSTSELNGVSINDERSESEWTGTAILSYKVTPDLMMYASYSRGYKAGGFNLDRSALKSPTLPFAATPGGAQALVGNLQFDQEINNAYEFGAKYSTGPLAINLAVFRQEFKNFQLNTFNGSVFLVQNVNACGAELNNADRDQSVNPGLPFFVAPTPTNSNPALGTGSCAADNVKAGVVSQGVEVEASLVPARDVRVGLGITYASTKYRNNLIGNARGLPLDPALRMLPGDNLSNAPDVVVTSSFAWTPDIGTSGLSGLFYVDSRLTGDYNTGSDLFPQKEQDSYVLVNGRIGIRGAEQKWAIEIWAQNLFDTNYTQVAFNTPFQQGPTSGAALNTAFNNANYPAGTQIFSAFLAEPRTYGITGRFRF